MLGNKNIWVDAKEILSMVNDRWRSLELNHVKKPFDSMRISEEELADYEELVRLNNLKKEPKNTRTRSKPHNTYKWNHVLIDIPDNPQGEGIDFLPSDIKSLQTKLRYLLGSF